MATAPLERRQVGGTTVGTQMISHNLYYSLQDGYILHRIVDNGGNSRNLGLRLWRSHIENTVMLPQPPKGSKRTRRHRLVASNGGCKCHIDFEGVELERGGTVRGFEPFFFFGADFDAHTVLYFVAAGVFQKLDEVNNAQEALYASDVSRWIAVEWRDIVATIGVHWWLRLATIGGGVERRRLVAPKGGFA